MEGNVVSTGEKNLVCQTCRCHTRGRRQIDIWAPVRTTDVRPDDTNETGLTEGNATKPTRERRGCTKSTNYYEWFILLNTIYHLSMNLLFCIYVWYNARVSQIVYIQPAPQVLSYRVPIDDSFVSGNHLESLQKLNVYGISSSQINLEMFLQTLRML